MNCRHRMRVFVGVRKNTWCWCGRECSCRRRIRSNNHFRQCGCVRVYVRVSEKIPDGVGSARGSFQTMWVCACMCAGMCACEWKNTWCWCRRACSCRQRERIISDNVGVRVYVCEWEKKHTRCWCRRAWSRGVRRALQYIRADDLQHLHQCVLSCLSQKLCTIRWNIIVNYLLINHVIYKCIMQDKIQQSNSKLLVNHIYTTSAQDV